MKEEENKDKAEEKFSKKKTLEICGIALVYMFLTIFFKTVLSFEEKLIWQEIFGSVLLQAYCAIVTTGIVGFLPIKNNYVKNIIVVCFIVFIDVFMDIKYVFIPSVQNIVMVAIAGACLVVFFLVLILHKRILAKISLKDNYKKQKRAEKLYLAYRIVACLLCLISFILIGIILCSNKEYWVINCASQ